MNAVASSSTYELMANRYRPSNPQAIEAEIHRLHKEHKLTPADISIALRIDHAQVVNILGSRGCSA